MADEQGAMVLGDVIYAAKYRRLMEYDQLTDGEVGIASFY